MLRILAYDPQEWAAICHRRWEDRQELEQRIAEIIATVQREGDRALCRYTEQWDGVALTPSRLRVKEEEIAEAYQRVDEEFLLALRRAKENIWRFHSQQKVRSWFDYAPDGVCTGQIIRPLRRVGIYVPGGTAAYPSSVLMNALPAKVAGVTEIVMVTPPARDGSVPAATLVAAAEAGVTEIYRVGGAQAIAALAYGTETIRPVDKITGPGNVYVALAKQKVFGRVDIDMLAGPSEILIIADSSADPTFVAADLLSQAEHDERACALLLTPDADLAEAVQKEVVVQLGTLPRRTIAERSLAQQGAAVICHDLEQAVALANEFAPEHLELCVAEPYRWLGQIQAAGAVFLGHYTPEPVGDYWAGPNHVLPTAGTARFASALGVEDFIRRISVIAYHEQALLAAGPGIIKLSEVEGLDAHGKAIEIRLNRLKASKCSR